MRVTGFPIVIIRQFERGIIEEFGKFNDYLESGIHFQVPIVNVMRIRDIREHTMHIDPQPVITKDNVEVKVDGLIWVRPGLDVEEIKKNVL